MRLVVNTSTNDGLKRVNSASCLTILLTRLLRSVHRTINCLTKSSNVCFIRCGNEGLSNANCRYFSKRRSTNCFAAQDGKKSTLRYPILVHKGRRIRDVHPICTQLFTNACLCLRASVKRTRQGRPHDRLLLRFANDNDAHLNRSNDLLFRLVVWDITAHFRFLSILIKQDSDKRFNNMFVHRHRGFASDKGTILLLRHVGRIRAFIRFVRAFKIRLCFVLLAQRFLQGVLRLSVDTFRTFNGFPNGQVGPLRTGRHIRTFLRPKRRTSFIQMRHLPCPVRSNLCLFHVTRHVYLLLRLLLLANERIYLFRLFRLRASVIFIQLVLVNANGGNLRVLLYLLPYSRSVLMDERNLFIVQRSIRCVRLGSLLIRRGILVLKVRIGRLFSRLLRLDR